ncbi:MAG: glycosyltransferase family 4 protein [Actinomycetota bacterium]
MTKPAVHQFVPTLEPGAVAAHTRTARDLLRAAGHESEIYANHVGAGCAGWGARPYRQYGRRGRGRRDDVLVYQMAIGSIVADFLVERPETLIVNHHNLTPGRFFGGWDATAAHGVMWGRQQLRELAPRTTLGIAVSQFNEQDLRDAGYRATTVVPFLFDPADIPADADATTRARLDSDRELGTANWLFVGRFVPNKRQHDVVKAFAAYRRVYDRHARLHLVGGGLNGRYGRAVRAFVGALGLDDAVELQGNASQAELAAYYQHADVFVIASEHEGFCVPLLEAWHHGVPVVAFDAGAISETLDGAGVVLGTKEPETVAAAVARVVDDELLRKQLLDAGTARLAFFDLARTGPAFVAAIESVGA